MLEPLVAEHPSFSEAHVSLATVYYRLGRSEDGDREQAIVQQLKARARRRARTRRRRSSRQGGGCPEP